MSAVDEFLAAVLAAAEDEARRDSSPTVEARHLLLALAGEPEAITQAVLGPVGLDHQGVRAALDREFEHSLSAVGVSPATYALPRPSASPDHPRLGSSAKLALERGFASVARKKDLRQAHLMLGVVRADVGSVPLALSLAGIDRSALVDGVREGLAKSVRPDGAEAP
jgi:D-alanyl-D-alanine carboxypeptidase